MNIDLLSVSIAENGLDSHFIPSMMYPNLGTVGLILAPQPRSRTIVVPTGDVLYARIDLDICCTERWLFATVSTRCYLRGVAGDPTSGRGKGKDTYTEWPLFCRLYPLFRESASKLHDRSHLRAWLILDGYKTAECPINRQGSSCGSRDLRSKSKQPLFPRWSWSMKDSFSYKNCFHLNKSFGFHFVFTTPSEISLELLES